MGPTEILLQWNLTKNQSINDNVTGYYVYYKDSSVISIAWQIVATPPFALGVNVSNLSPATTYDMYVVTGLEDGNGPASSRIISRTLEGGKRLLNS